MKRLSPFFLTVLLLTFTTVSSADVWCVYNGEIKRATESSCKAKGGTGYKKTSDAKKALGKPTGGLIDHSHDGGVRVINTAQGKVYVKGTLYGMEIAGDIIKSGSYGGLVSGKGNTEDQSVGKCPDGERNNYKGECVPVEGQKKASESYTATASFSSTDSSSSITVTGSGNVISEPIQIANADLELEFWRSIKDSDDAEMLQAYLDKYPNGEFASLANIKLKKFGKTDASSNTKSTETKPEETNAESTPEKTSVQAEKISHTYSDGSTYVGEVLNGWQHGNGILNYANGMKYDGEWKEGKWHGQGTQTFPDGGSFIGEYKDGAAHGYGVETRSDGAKYEGEFKNNLRDGQGTWTVPDGASYVGQWKDGLHDGKGTYTYGKGKWEGQKYVGEYKYGKKDGQGTFYYQTGDKYIGEWTNNQKNGTGTYIFASGKEDTCIWDNGQCSKVVSSKAGGGSCPEGYRNNYKGDCVGN